MDELLDRLEEVDVQTREIIHASSRQRPPGRDAWMSCHSGGTVEIFVEPVLPKPALVHRSDGPDGPVYFCCGGCRQRYDREPGRYPLAPAG